MKWKNLVRRWTMRSIHSAILGAALAGSANLAFAQAPGVQAAQAARPNYAKSQTFELPVRMDPAERLALSEIRLYVRTPTTNWTLHDKGPPTLERFRCRVTQDGEYWYALATVDRNGQMSPADVNVEPPSQRVIVDTSLPTIQIQPCSTADGDYGLRCTVLDANPDHASLKAVSRTDHGDIPLDQVPNQPGVFRVRNSEMTHFPVVVSVHDLAGNFATKEINVREMVGLAPMPMPMLPKGLTEIAQTSMQPGLKDRGTLPAPRPELPGPRVETPPIQKTDGPGALGGVTRFDGAPLDSLPKLPGGIIPNPGIELPRNPLPVQPVAMQQGAVPHQLINTTRATIEYRLDQVGPSGVGRVEIYMTSDKGQTWHRLAEDADKRSPAEVSLPGDGAFGIRIVVTNGNGFGGKAPVRGDAPHCTVEVDTTSPFVQLRSADVLPRSGHVELRWNATDNNLGSEPVSLFYRTRPDGPWQAIVRNAKNDGVYRWAIPRDAGTQFFFKIEVADRAGNVAQDTSRQPVTIDLSEPRATVVGVTSSSGTPALPRVGP